MQPDPYWPFFNPLALSCASGSRLGYLQPTLKRLAPPAPLLSLAEARLHLKLDPLPVDADGTLMADEDVPPHPDDSLVRGLVRAAQAEVDGWNSWLGRGVAPQQWVLTFRGFPQSVVLPLPPLLSVDSVTHRLADGTRATVSDDLYSVREGVDGLSVLSVNAGAYWPIIPTLPAGLYADAVQVTFTCGYEADDPDLELIKAYAKLRLGMFYENREAVIVGTIATELPGFSYMLENLRVSHPDFLK